VYAEEIGLTPARLPQGSYWRSREVASGQERVLRDGLRQPGPIECGLYLEPAERVVERELVRAGGVGHGFGSAHHKLCVKRESPFFEAKS
jgi:hypothetical protein